MPTTRKGLAHAALWSVGLTVAAGIFITSWRLSPWPSILLITVFAAGVAIPLGVALGMIIPAGRAAKRQHAEPDR